MPVVGVALEPARLYVVVSRGLGAVIVSGDFLDFEDTQVRPITYYPSARFISL
jgi:hypothetical protein